MKKILVIDDEATIRDNCKRILAGIDLEVDTAVTAEEGVELIKRKKYSVLLLDMVLPGMSGLEMIDVVKKISAKTEIIIITGNATVENAIESMKKGVYDYITKPFEINELRKSVLKALEKKKLAGEVSSLKGIVSIYKVAQAMGSLMPLNEILKIIFDSASSAVHADGGSISLIDVETGELVVELSEGKGKDKSMGTRLKIGERISGYAALKKEPILINGDIKDDERFKNVNPFNGIKSGISAPMLIKGKVIGTLNFKRTGIKEKFTKHDLEISAIFAHQAAFAVQNAIDFEKLKELDDLKTEFIANASHELKTPLQSILNSVELISKTRKDKITEVLMRNALRMKKLVFQLLDLTRMEKGDYKLNFTKLNLSIIINEAVEEIKTLADEKNIKLKNEVSITAVVKVDKEAIKRVLLNIIENAIKYSPEGSIVIVSMKETQNNFKVSIKDNGQGVSLDEQKKIFEKFYQQKPDATLTKKYKGLGLGLSIVKELVQLHNGSIYFDSVPGKGSTLHFTIPKIS